MITCTTQAKILGKALQKASGSEFAPGIKDPEDLGSAENLTPGDLVPWVVQEHTARRAGRHYDVRLGKDKMLSWAARKELPKPGEKQRVGLYQQPAHEESYRFFEGKIPLGYGEGEVRQTDLGEALILESQPDKIKFALSQRGTPNVFTLIRIKDEDSGKPTWIMMNTTPTKAVEHKKLRYTKVPADQIDKLFDKKYVMAEKIDGAAALLRLLEDKVEVLSYRSSKTGKPIVHTQRLGLGAGKTKIPKELRGKTIRGEIWGERKGKAIPAAELGGLLNAALGKSLTDQKEKGTKLRMALFGIADGDDWSASPVAERRKKVQEVLQHLPSDVFHEPEYAEEPEAMRRLWGRIIAKKHPRTAEGVVAFPVEGGKPFKAKTVDEQDVYIREVFPGAGKYEGQAAGGFTYSLTPKGKIVGKVGTGLSDEERRRMWAAPEEYVGRVARIQAQEQFPSGAFRSPRYIARHEDFSKVSAYQVGYKLADNKEDGMEAWFKKRTRRHINLVKKYCKRIIKAFPDQFSELKNCMSVHDDLKFKDPEYEPYVHVTWRYKCKDEGKDYDVPAHIEDKMDAAITHHVTNSRHHPEFHCGRKDKLINSKDRDKAPSEIVDATKMPELDVAEMCADWCAVAEEKGNQPKKWADDNISKRWRFTEKQKKLIYDIIDKVWDASGTSSKQSSRQNKSISYCLGAKLAQENKVLDTTNQTNQINQTQNQSATNYTPSQLYNAISVPETGGEENPWIRTKSRPEAGSSAWGPVQITGTLARDYYNRFPDIFSSEQQDYLREYIDQADLFLKHGRGDELPTLPEGYDPRYEYGGPGHLAETQEQKDMYRSTAETMMQHMYETGANRDINRFIRRWRGKDESEASNYYQQVRNELVNLLASENTAVRQPDTASEQPLAVSQAPATPPTLTHTIKPGDTLSELAAQYNTTVNDLVRLNSIADPNKIRAGETLVLPQANMAETEKGSAIKQATSASQKAFLLGTAMMGSQGLQHWLDKQVGGASSGAPVSSAGVEPTRPSLPISGFEDVKYVAPRELPAFLEETGQNVVPEVLNRMQEQGVVAYDPKYLRQATMFPSGGMYPRYGMGPNQSTRLAMALGSLSNIPGAATGVATGNPILSALEGLIPRSEATSEYINRLNMQPEAAQYIDKLTEQGGNANRAYMSYLLPAVLFSGLLDNNNQGANAQMGV